MARQKLRLNLDGPCKHCGLTLRQHTDLCECRYIFAPCSDALRVIMPGMMETHADEFGNCVDCGEPMLDHFAMKTISIPVMGKLIEPRELRYVLPTEFKGCPPCEL